MQYNLYLHSEHWQNKRKETLLKQGKNCRVCGSDENINIHHRRYKYNGESVLGKEINQILLPLCRDCHGLWHKLHGYKHIPFPSLRMKLQAGIPKVLAFKKPYSKIKTLLLEVKAPYIGKPAEQVKQLHDYNQSGAGAEVTRVLPGMKKQDQTT